MKGIVFQFGNEFGLKKLNENDDLLMKEVVSLVMRIKIFSIGLKSSTNLFSNENLQIRKRETKTRFWYLEMNSIDDERRQRLQDLHPTDEELKYLEKLHQISKEAKNSNGGSFYSPSMVIDDFLYLGDLGHAIDFHLLTRYSIKNILNVCDCPLHESMKDKIRIHWIGDLSDHPHANIRRFFDETNQFLIECEQRSEKVLVHCQAGISRSSTIVLAYLIKFVFFLFFHWICFFFLQISS